MARRAALPVSDAASRAVGAERAALSSRAAMASVALAVILLAAKAWAATQTDSTAMLGSLADTALDLIASVATLAGVTIAAQPADREHRFGHGKAEALVALGQVVLISLSAVWIAWRAIKRLINGGATAQMELGIGVSIFAIAATLLLLAYQRRVIARTGSVAIRTDKSLSVGPVAQFGGHHGFAARSGGRHPRGRRNVRNRHRAVAAV